MSLSNKKTLFLCQMQNSNEYLLNLYALHRRKIHDKIAVAFCTAVAASQTSSGNITFTSSRRVTAVSDTPHCTLSDFFPRL